MTLKLSIHYKIILILTGTVAVILSGTYFYLNDNLRALTYRRIQSNLSKELNLAQLHLDGAGTDLSPDTIDPVANAIGARLGVRATVIELDGRVLGDSELDGEALRSVENHLFRPEVQDALAVGFGESRRFSTTIQKDMLYMARPFGRDARQGYIRLAIPLSEIEVVSERLKGLLSAAFLFAFFFATLIGSTAFIFVTKPIKEISSVAREIAMGNYTKRVSFSTGDEISELGRSINYMSEQIRTRIEEVISNKSRFEAVLLSMVEGTMVVDNNGTIVLMNGILREFFRIDRDPMGKRPLEMIRNIEIQETVDSVLSSGEPVASREITILLPEEKTFQLHAAPVLREEKRDGAVLVFHDITELKRLENIRKDFVANVSHEIKTPLTSIKGYTETLLDGAIEDKENARDFLEIIGADSNRLVQLVDDLLDLSKIESGKLNLQLAPYSLRDVVGRVTAGFKKRTKEEGVTITEVVPAGLPDVRIDEASVAQVLVNLIDNGIKYNRQGGTVTVSAKEDGSFIRVDVTDTGIGIPEEDIARIFERFYRVDKARSRQLGGTGLGLSIVKHIVQAHGGDVFVTSRPEQGSTFSFTLPKA